MKIGIPTDPYKQRRHQFINLVMKRVKPGSGSGEDFLLRRTWSHPVTDIKAILKKTLCGCGRRSHQAIYARAHDSRFRYISTNGRSSPLSIKN